MADCEGVTSVNSGRRCNSRERMFVQSVSRLTVAARSRFPSIRYRAGRADTGHGSRFRRRILTYVHSAPRFVVTARLRLHRQCAIEIWHSERRIQHLDSHGRCFCCHHFSITGCFAGDGGTALGGGEPARSESRYLMPWNPVPGIPTEM